MWHTREVWTAHTAARTPSALVPARRARVKRRIEQLDLDPSLPPSAVLVVRTLRGPIGGRDLRERVAHFARTAARPARSSATGAVDAVLFADVAEMLACLLRDVVHGRHHACWWWRGVVVRLPRALTVESILSSQPRLVPAIVVALAEPSLVTQVASRLSRPAAAALVRAMLDAHGASQVAARFDEARTGLIPAVAGRSFGRARIAEPPRVATPFQDQDAGDRRLPPEHRALLAFATTLARAPQQMSSPALVESASDWLATVFAAVVAGEQDRARDVRDPAREHGRTPTVDESSISSDREDTGPVSAQTRTPFHRPEGPPSPPGRIDDPGLDTEMSAPDVLRPRDADVSVADVSRRHRSTDASASPAVTAPHAPNAGDRTVTFAEQGAAVDRAPGLDGATTSLGGVLYLINVIEQLRARDQGALDWPSHISHWRLLEEAARGLLRAAQREHDADGVWPSLRAMAGDTEPDEEIVAASWADRAVPAIAAFASHALTLDPTAMTALVETLLTVRGRIFVTAMHVDLVASLDQVRVPVRIAGFDLNPGWLPEWGRVVLFHFDDQAGGLT